MMSDAERSSPGMRGGGIVWPDTELLLQKIWSAAPALLFGLRL
jgi:hypothetical protein